ncbi:nucleotidyltransferase family protein [Clostridium chrysemydis]|uniref:nucleotidyltransferase domain-containing protein n=1 Tax=Clostridium chrysemydis TaxID=2665504 RepID=UPI0018843F29|nr:nucleotidyltransferase family protein [Clostridium chrysemydis]
MKREEYEVLNIIKCFKIKKNYNISDDLLIDKVIRVLENQKLMDTVYKTIKYSESWILENSDRHKLLKLKAMNTAITNSEKFNELSRILKIFNDFNIEVIVLKGIVIRKLYRNPDLRTMNDFDILVKENDIEKSKEILKSFNYKEDIKENDIHYVFRKNSECAIELHFKLVNENFFRGNTEFQDEVWDKKIIEYINGEKCYALSVEHSILHLFIHKAVHMVYGGIGLRQLLDLVLILEEHSEVINWSVLEFELKRAGLDKFSKVTLAVCNKYLDYKLPLKIDDRFFDTALLENYMEEIFKKGMEFNSQKNRKIEVYLAYRKGESLNRNIISFIFPKVEEMGEKYKYASKSKILIPLAWIHRLILGSIINKNSLKYKKEFLIKTLKNANKKNKLFTKLEL